MYWNPLFRLRRYSGLSRDLIQNVGDVAFGGIGNVDPVHGTDLLYQSFVRQIGMKIAEAGFVRNECPREFQDTTDEILREFRVLINAFSSGEVRQCPLPSPEEPESYSRTA
jgi:hypothetical protein